jgi:hypothetical protein
MPFLTFYTVKSHRALRQAIRLAEKVEKLKHKSSGGDPENDVTDIRQEAGYGILEEEICKGLELLDDSEARLFEEPDGFVGNPVRDMEQEPRQTWLKRLEEIHAAIRKKSTSKAPKVLEWLERFLDAIEIVRQPWSNHQTSKQEALMENYLQPGQSKGLHPSRTLDQYYYAALPDTSLRDIDQVIRRYQARKRAEQLEASPKGETHCYHDQVEKIRSKRKAHSEDNEKNKKESSSDAKNEMAWEDDREAKIAMVDQLWLWIVDDGKNSKCLLQVQIFMLTFGFIETVITCFPQSSDTQGENGRDVDLLNKIRTHIHDESRPLITSVYHLATIITSFCISHVEDCKALFGSYEDTLLDMFANSIGILVSHFCSMTHHTAN